MARYHVDNRMTNAQQAITTTYKTITQSDLSVSVSGHLQIFGRFARPVHSV
jgi:hypothetical protein